MEGIARLARLGDLEKAVERRIEKAVLVGVGVCLDLQDLRGSRGTDAQKVESLEYLGLLVAVVYSENEIQRVLLARQDALVAEDAREERQPIRNGYRENPGSADRAVDGAVVSGGDADAHDGNREIHRTPRLDFLQHVHRQEEPRSGMPREDFGKRLDRVCLCRLFGEHCDERIRRRVAETVAVVPPEKETLDLLAPRGAEIRDRETPERVFDACVPGHEEIESEDILLLVDDQAVPVRKERDLVREHAVRNAVSRARERKIRVEVEQLRARRGRERKAEVVRRFDGNGERLPVDGEKRIEGGHDVEYSLRSRRDRGPDSLEERFPAVPDCRRDYRVGVRLEDRVAVVDIQLE